MKIDYTKIVGFILIAIFISGCNSTKKIPKNKLLLTKNQIIVNNKVTLSEGAYNQLYQKTNGKLAGFKLRLFLYNLANSNPDSTFQARFIDNKKKYEKLCKWLSAKQVDELRKSFYYKGIHDFLKDVGEPPVIIDKLKTEKTVKRLNAYYFNNGYFDVKTTYKIDTIAVKKGKVKYDIDLGKPYYLDTIRVKIATPALDSLYNKNKNKSFIKSKKQYKIADFEDEKNRISNNFRNNGAYDFQPNYITFDLDTINKEKKVNVTLIIKDFSYIENDSTKEKPFKLYKISKVNVFTDYKQTKTNNSVLDTVAYNNFTLLSNGKLKYKPYAITNPIFVSKGAYYSENKTTLSTRYLNNLKIFNYPSIQYQLDKKDPKEESLMANVYLTPRKNYNFGASFDVTHSNIQDVGIGFNVSESVRNLFKGAEVLQIAARGNLGSSKDLANPKGLFFNILEYGLDFKLNFPRMLFFFNTEKIIPKSMLPSTQISTGISKQTNIGLDKENVTGAFTYTWTPRRNYNSRLDLFNIQFVRNLNPDNYFNVYSSSYNNLNTIAKVYNTNPDFVDSKNNLIIKSGTTGFANAVLNLETALRPENTEYKTVQSIEESRLRLIENDFILASNYSYTKSTRKDINDNNFHIFKTKIETAGTLLSLIAKAGNLPKDDNGRYKIFNLEYAEYLKTDLDYIKHWDLGREQVIAFRSFLGIAIPFGNADYVPFSRSYYSGGSNDNRAWKPYSLGPGSTASVDDFNEANLKLALSLEYRFKILGSFKGAIFSDAGNIWNVFNNAIDTKSTFTSVKNLKDIALGSGFGLRYDFNFFVIRFDLGFKTYNPAYDVTKRWFREYNFANSVLNFGINYPF